LDNGNEVILVGETGSPLWLAKAIGAPELSQSLTGDQTNSFEAINTTVLEFAPRIPLRNFSVRGELRFAESRIGLDATEHPDAGLFIGGQKTVSAEGDTMLYTAIGFSFEDGPTAGPNNAIRFASLRVIQRQGESPTKGKMGLAHSTFTPSARLPGPWRQFEIEVRDDIVIPRVSGIPMAIGVEGGVLNANSVQHAMGRQEKTYQKNPALAGLKMPVFDGRAAVGLWSYKASVDFRNVVLKPLP